MNEHETISVLQLRRDLTNDPYRSSTVATWADALSEELADDVNRAVTQLARESKPVNIPTIRDWLRAERHRLRILADAYQPTCPPPADYEEDPAKRRAIVEGARADRAARVAQGGHPLGFRRFTI